MIIKTIAMLGGTGFVGRRLANRLVRQGYRVKILTRDRERNKEDLILLPNLDLIETNVNSESYLTEHLDGCDAVINLVGILNESGTNGEGFEKAHVVLTKNVINACQSLGIKRLLHMSALNADPNGASHYLKTKGVAEDLVHAAKGIQTTSFRPSVIFGPEDSFFNRFALLLKIFPVFPLACADARFAPVFIDDLTSAMAQTLKNPDYYGQRLDICGHEEYTLLELVKYTAECLEIKRMIVPLPDMLARIQALGFDLAGFVFNLVKIEKPFSTDNFHSLQVDSISSNNTLNQFVENPVSIKAVVPDYLNHQSYRSDYMKYRQ
ncbi:MAG: complex I NDUFA9 subunit family protein, partial [Gammaproteobacteria bacterium]|nr:complex I NDUFA9 subunit family protein [Gammaproteobacteria bacterium]